MKKLVKKFSSIGLISALVFGLTACNTEALVAAVLEKRSLRSVLFLLNAKEVVKRALFLS
jgi:hypothetical protein